MGTLICPLNRFYGNSDPKPLNPIYPKYGNLNKISEHQLSPLQPPPGMQIWEANVRIARMTFGLLGFRV